MITNPRTLSSIECIRSLPSELEASLDGLTDLQLDTPYRIGGWTLRQVVHHLADSHANALIRMKLVLTEETPVLKPYDQDAWAELPDCKLMPVVYSLEILRGLHAKWSYMLSHITDEQLTRKGNHLDDGEVTLEGLIDGYAQHGINHLAQINGLREKMGWI